MKGVRRAAACASFAVTIVACSPTDRATPSVTARRETTIETLRRFPAFAQHLGMGITLRPTSLGFRLEKPQGWSPAQPVLDVTLPKAADGAVRITIAGRADLSLDVYAIDAHERDARATEQVDGAIVHHDVARGVDLVHVLEQGRVEELRVLHDATAPSIARWRIDKGAGITAVRARTAEPIVEVLDRSGAIVLTTTAMFAADSRGVRRALAVSVEDHGDDAIITATLDTTGLVYPVVVDPLWTATGTMVSPMLQSGAAVSGSKVLVYGGTKVGAPGGNDHGEVYDATTNAWTATPNLPMGFSRSSASTLSDGTILVAGGFDESSTNLATAYLYDPTANTWTPTTSMKSARAAHAAAPLPGGKIGVFGGSGSAFSSIAAAEAFDPSTKTWSDLAPMPFARSSFTATTLVSGKVLVAGGYGTTAGETACALYDPVANTWSSAHALNSGRYIHLAARLAGGQVLVAGGFSGATVLPRGEIYDPVADTWTVTGLQTTARSYPVLAPLGSGRALLAGGSDATAEIYDPLANTWSATASMAHVHQGAISAVLSGDRILVAGGNDAASATSGEVYAQYDLGAACTLSTDCRSGYCTEGVCCGVASCGAGKTCAFPGKSGACVNTTGTACAAATDCGSGHCVDGYCCGTACTDQCAACDVAGKLGICSPATGLPHASHAACTGTGTGTPCGPTCNGTDTTKCNYLAAGVTACGTDACAAGKETHVGTCDGAGACNDAAQTCGAYACGTKTCDTTCTTSAECAAGYFCKGTACAPVVGLGETCVDTSTCKSGLFCTDGVCCGEAACGAGKSCAAGTPGVCLTKNGIACSIDGDCGSAHCVDGVCCATACDGQCEACDVPGKAGACSPISGAPHGTKRPKCSDGAGDICKALSCDGAKDASKCVAFANGSKTQCKAASCGAGGYVGPSTCDGAGACVAPSPSSCVPYACDVTGCKTSCSDASPCSTGYTCKAGTCVLVGATCSGDGTTSVSKDGTNKPCAPFRCLDVTGTCATTCETSSDCAPSSTCDQGSKTCIPTPDAPPSDDSGSGCAFGSHGGDSGWLGGLLGLCAAALARGRRRRAGA